MRGSEGRSHELLYSIPTALCEEIASAATAELADRLSIPDGRGSFSYKKEFPKEALAGWRQ